MPVMNLAPPGAQYGPCNTDCPHPRCKRSRKIADSICRLCTEEIGYETDYVQDRKRPAGEHVHADCRKKEIAVESDEVPQVTHGGAPVHTRTRDLETGGRAGWLDGSQRGDVLQRP